MPTSRRRPKARKKAAAARAGKQPGNQGGVGTCRSCCCPAPAPRSPRR